MLPATGLVKLTGGIVSGLEVSRRYVVIKSSGLPYGARTADTMVVVSAHHGMVVEGELGPSSDTLAWCYGRHSPSGEGSFIHIHPGPPREAKLAWRFRL
jgi:L-ribulose-5-phosphate 4-epimerase